MSQMGRKSHKLTTCIKCRGNENIYSLFTVWENLFFDICFIKFQCCELYLRSVVLLLSIKNYEKKSCTQQHTCEKRMKIARNHISLETMDIFWLTSE